MHLRWQTTDNGKDSELESSHLIVRIAVGIDYRPALLSSSGIGRATRELTKALARRDDLDLRLFGHSLARARVRCEIPQGVRLHRLPIPGRSLPTLRRLGLGADRLCGSPAVFHDTDYVELPIANALRIRTIHDLAFFREPSWHGADALPLRERTRAFASKADVIITPSRATANDVRRLLPEASSPIVIPFGADHVSPSQSVRRNDVVLCVGTVEPRKNHRALLAAIRSLRKKPLLVVLGRRGWECNAIEADLHAAQAEGWCEWREDADDDAVFAAMRDATMLAFPSLWEGFGFPPLEAMASGLPVLAHDCEPMRELTDGCALLCDATREGDLAAAIERLLGDTSLRDELAKQGIRRAAAFQWSDCAAGHAKVYREALQ